MQKYVVLSTMRRCPPLLKCKYTCNKWCEQLIKLYCGFVSRYFSIYGPNSEIEWNREGARGFSILSRSTPQTALSLLADKAAELGDELNAKLPQPASTQRNHVLRPIDDDTEFSPKIITADPVSIPTQHTHIHTPTQCALFANHKTNSIFISSASN